MRGAKARLNWILAGSSLWSLLASLSEVRLTGKCFGWVSECKINTENGVECLIAIKSEGEFLRPSMLGLLSQSLPFEGRLRLLPQGSIQDGAPS